MNNFFNNLKEQFRRNPILFIFIILIFVRAILSSGSLGNWLYSKILILPGIIIGLSVHEAAHAFASYKLGDFTPKAQGRVTLNPLAHIDLLGFFFLIFSGFGWGKPVQINSSAYKNRRKGEIIVSLSGVIANLGTAFILSFVYKGITLLLTKESYAGVLGLIYSMIFYAIYINVVLFIFNLIPCPPLDGWGFITALFKLDRYEWWYKVYNNAYFILLMIIILDVPSYLISFFGPKIIGLMA